MSISVLKLTEVNGMRVGIIAPGLRGDIEPYVTLGKGLQQAGYEVCVLTHETFER